VIEGLQVPTSVVRALDAEATSTEPYERRHGARHTAAFSLAASYPGAVAFVFSEDGPVSCALNVDGQLIVWPVQLLET
jgi:DNA integrity scanning protein DisA with diadenylate cyclase activity